jgi:hypothetical protein
MLRERCLVTEINKISVRARKINLEWADGLSMLCEIQGKMCQVFVFKEVHGDCRQLCKYLLRRPHLSCRGCRLKAVNQGKKPRILEVEPYVLLLEKNRSRLKARLCKLFLSLAEVFSSR